jgi:hypothetical protein
MMAPILATYGFGKDFTHGRPYVDRVRVACAHDLKACEPGRIIAMGISPPRGSGDDDAWERLCSLFTTLGSAKEYWSGVLRERQAMARYGFAGRDGWFDELLRSLA